jgi:hypothetical protein
MRAGYANPGVEEKPMNLMFVAVAFASLSAAPADQAPSAATNESGSARTEASTSSSGANGQAAGERRVCRNIVVSGSNRPRRVCMTAAQWRQQEDQD